MLQRCMSRALFKTADELFAERNDSHTRVELDFVLVGSNPDDGSKMVAFGFHIQELPQLPVGSLARVNDE